MANRFPLIIDTDDNNKIKELPVGDNLNLSGSGIINASSVSTVGAITCASVTVGGTPLSTVALSGSYNDLDNTPVLFSGNYNDLSSKPFIPTLTTQLQDVASTLPTDGQGLIYNGTTARYEPVSIDTTVDLGNHNIEELNNVVISSDPTNKWLKYYSGAWRSASIQYNDINNTPTSLSQFTNDLGFLNASDLEGSGSTINLSIKGSVFGDDSTLLVDGLNSVITGDVANNSVATGALTNTFGSPQLVIDGVESALVITNSNPLNPGAGQGNISIVSQDNGLLMRGNAYVSIDSGADGQWAGDLDIRGGAVTITSSSLYLTTDSGNDGKLFVTGDVDFTAAPNIDFTGSTISGLNFSTLAVQSLDIGDNTNQIRPYTVLGTDTLLMDTAGTYIQSSGVFDVDATGNVILRSTGGTITVDAETQLTIISGNSGTGYAPIDVYSSDVTVNAPVTFNQVLQLPKLNSAPASPVNGMIAMQDGTNWNISGRGQQDIVVYMNNNWYYIDIIPVP